MADQGMSTPQAAIASAREALRPLVPQRLLGGVAVVPGGAALSASSAFRPLKPGLSLAGSPVSSIAPFNRNARAWSRS